MFRIEELNESQDLFSVQVQWEKAVFATNDLSIFQTFAYISTWWEHFGENKSLRIIIVRDPANSIVSIIPLYQTKKHGFKVYRLIGDDYADYIHISSTINPNQLAKVLNQFLMKDQNWDCIEFNGIVVGSSTEKLINELSIKQFKKVVDKRVHFAPQITINNNWDDYYNDLDKKTRKDVEYNNRRLNKIGNLTVEDVKYEEIEICLNNFFSMHKQRHANERITSIFENKKNRDFIAGLSKKLAKKKWLHFSKLTLNDEILSMHLGFLFNNWFYYYLPVYNEKYSKYSSGKLLLLELIKRSFDENHACFDFMAGNEKYKYLYADNEQKLINVKVLKKTSRGITFRYLVLFREKGSKMKSFLTKFKK